MTESLVGRGNREAGVTEQIEIFGEKMTPTIVLEWQMLVSVDFSSSLPTTMRSGTRTSRVSLHGTFTVRIQRQPHHAPPVVDRRVQLVVMFPVPIEVVAGIDFPEPQRLGDFEQVGVVLSVVGARQPLVGLLDARDPVHWDEVFRLVRLRRCSFQRRWCCASFETGPIPDEER